MGLSPCDVDSYLHTTHNLISILKKGDHMAENGFCWKCARYVEELLQEGKIEKIYPWDHCHHEPKEKPECWCDSHGKIPVGFLEPKQMNFCPQCGRGL